MRKNEKKEKEGKKYIISVNEIFFENGKKEKMLIIQFRNFVFP